MAVYHVTDPTGATYEVTAPEGATQQQIIEFARAQQAPQNFAQMTQNWDQSNPFNAGQAALIGAGRTFNQVGAGVNQIALNADIAARQAMGLDSGDQFRKLNALDAEQQDEAARYAPLQQQHPFATALGESLPLLAVPAGQSTAVARAAVPSIVNAAIEGLSYGSPQERMARAKVGLATGLAGGAVGEGVRAVVAPAESSLNAAQQTALRNATDTLGIQPRASQLSGNQNVARLEDYLKVAPGGANVMGNFIANNEAKINQAAASAIGENAASPTSDVLGAASTRIGGALNDLRENATMPVTSDVTDAIDRATALLNKGSVSGKGDALGMLSELKNKLLSTRELSGDEYQAWASDLSTAARETNNRTISTALSGVKAAMDKVAQGENAPAWKQANQQWASLETLLKPGVVNAQTGQVNPVALARVMNSQFGKNMKTGKIQGPLADIANYGMALPPMREGSPTFGRQAFASVPGWIQAIPNYLLAKTLTSGVGADYLARGLLANPAVSQATGGLLGRAAVPLTVPFATNALLGNY